MKTIARCWTLTNADSSFITSFYLPLLFVFSMEICSYTAAMDVSVI